MNKKTVLLLQQLFYRDRDPLMNDRSLLCPTKKICVVEMLIKPKRSVIMSHHIPFILPKKPVYNSGWLRKT